MIIDLFSYMHDCIGFSNDTFNFSCKKTHWSNLHTWYFFFKKNYNLHAKFMILMLVFPFFFFTLFFWKNIIFILYTWPIYTFLFVHFFYSFIICFLMFFFFTIFVFGNLFVHELRKRCFTIAIATLFHFSAMLKNSLRSYIFLLMHMIFIIWKRQLCDSRLYFLFYVKKCANNT
jgi:hypothetical protein